MDLFDAPLNLVRELYYYTFMIKEQREQERKKEEKEKKEKEEKEKEREKINKRNPSFFERRLSPAAQAREARHMKSQDDELKKSEENKSESTAEIAPPQNIDMEELIDVLEEGG